MGSAAVGVLFAVPTTSEPVEFPAWWTWAETVGRGFMYLETLALFSIAGRYRSAPDA